MRSNQHQQRCLNKQWVLIWAPTTWACWWMQSPWWIQTQPREPEVWWFQQTRCLEPRRLTLRRWTGKSSDALQDLLLLLGVVITSNSWRLLEALLVLAVRSCKRQMELWSPSQFNHISLQVWMILVRNELQTRFSTEFEFLISEPR